MTTVPPAAGGPSLQEAVRRARSRLVAVAPHGQTRWLLVDASSQRLALVLQEAVTAVWSVSTAAAGLDNREGSHGTPPGVHAIERKLGHDQPSGAVFVSRRPTGEIWTPGPPEPAARDDRDLILTRVLTLAGLEDGVNRGPGIDSRDRFIYIHGTNHEDRIGEAVSHGCIRMSNTDVIHLFQNVDEGDPVVIV